MWIFTDSGFVSLVTDRQDPEIIQVRSRTPEDILGLFPDAQVIIANGGDYRYRARIDRLKVAETIAFKVMDIDYDSHAKDVMIQRAPKHMRRSAVLYSIWRSWADMQDYAPYSRVERGKENWRKPIPGQIPAEYSRVKTGGQGWSATYDWAPTTKKSASDPVDIDDDRDVPPELTDDETDIHAMTDAEWEKYLDQQAADAAADREADEQAKKKAATAKKPRRNRNGKQQPKG